MKEVAKLSTVGAEISRRSGRYFAEITERAALLDAVLTWDGYLTAATEWGFVGISEHRDLMLKLFARVDGKVLNINPAGIAPNIEEEWKIVDQERRLAEGDADVHHGYRTSYWGCLGAIRGFLRAASSNAERREVALTWSGYVVALEEHGLVPPGHAARLMAELVPHLRPGDPWETIAAQAGVALGTAEAAHVRQQG